MFPVHKVLAFIWGFYVFSQSNICSPDPGKSFPVKAREVCVSVILKTAECKQGLST